MEYIKLVEIYEKLEKTSKRLEKTHIISEFLKKTNLEDLLVIVLLLQGKLFPNWDENKIGVASRLILKAINTATGINAKKIEDEWRKTGDLGIVAENLVGRKKQATLFSRELSVKNVFNNLRKLAELEGIGTVERKMQLIAELLTSAKPIEAKYIVRTILEELRVGVGEGILRDAIVWAFFGDKIGLKYLSENKIDIESREEYNKYIDAVQRAYDLTNDFSSVAEAAKLGLKKLDEMGVVVFRPLKVMLALKVKDSEEGFERCGKPVDVEYKLDGFRCVSGFTPIYVKDKGIVVVRDIKVGDYVLTHNGEHKRVTAKNTRRIDEYERIFRFQTFLGNEFKITEKHKMWIWGDNKPVWKAIEKIKISDEAVFPVPNFKIKKLPKSMVLSTTDEYKKKISFNKNFFRFLGYWIGDGYTNTSNRTYRVGLIFNKKHKELLKFYKKLVMSELGITRISESPYSGGVICLYWTDRPLLKWLSQNFRNKLKSGWKGKTLPSWFFGISKENFIEFLKGWTEADGYTDKLNRTSVTTKESSLATSAQLIALKFGIILALKRIRVYGKTYFKLIIVKDKRRARINGDKLITKILKLEELRRKHPRGIDPRTQVHNLQVVGDKSYCTTLVALHNCQIHKKDDKIKIFTRRLEDVTAQFPEVVDYVKKNVKGNSFIIDSEAAGFNPKTGKYLPFQSISQRIRRKYDIEEMSKKFPVELNVFDILYYNGKTLINEDFKKRRELIEKIITQKPRKIVVVKNLISSSEKEAEKFYKESLNAGNEGIMFKKLDAPYKPGARVNFMVKLKPVMTTLDLVIVGAEWGEGKRANWLSSFTLACTDEDGNFLEIGKMGTGIKEKSEEGISFEQLTEELKPLVTAEKGREVKVKPKIVVEVRYEEIQKSPTYSSGYALRFPRLVNLRSDRDASEASTLDMVEDLYYGQKKK